MTHLRRLVLVLTLAALTTVCRDKPAAPTAPTVNLSSVAVGVLGDAAPRIQLQKSLQLYAKATDAAGSAFDVTNAAQWSSSNPAVISVSSGGVVTGVAIGTAVVTATYLKVPGGLSATVVSTPCEASTVTPPALVFSAHGYSNCWDDGAVCCNGQKLLVNAAQSSCAWTATVDVPWLGIDCYAMKPSFTAPVPGSGSFWYAARPNNTTVPRVGHIDIQFNDGSSIRHTVTVEAPVCSYVVNPETSTVPSNGGAGSFDLIVTPSTCAWVAPRYLPTAPIQVSPQSGTGSQRITYRIVRASAVSTWDISFGDPDGRYPSASHRVRVGE